MKKSVLVLAMLLVIGTGSLAYATPVSYNYSGNFYWGDYAAGGEYFSGTVSYDDVSGTVGTLTVNTSLGNWSGTTFVWRGYNGPGLDVMSAYDAGTGVSISLDLFVTTVQESPTLFVTGHNLYFYFPSEYAGGNGGQAIFTPTNAVPEPASTMLVGLGLLGIAAIRRFKK